MQCSLLSDISVGLIYITSLLYSHSFVYPSKRACDSAQTQQPTDYRMTLKIRKATEEDEASVSRICLLTADAGASATALHDFGELPGLIYAVPYVKFPTTWGFVLEDESTREVVGYILGSTDTRAYERYLAEHWWPALAEKYPVEKAVKPADIYYTNLLRNMHTASDSNIAFSPAHLHIDILEAYQKQGWGRLIAVAVQYLITKGLQGVWLGLDPRNEGARKFYKKLQFNAITGAPDENQMGLRFADFTYISRPVDQNLRILEGQCPCYFHSFLSR